MVKAVEEHRIDLRLDDERQRKVVLLKENSRLLIVHFKGITEFIVIPAVGNAWCRTLAPLLHRPRTGLAENVLVTLFNLRKHDLRIV